MTATNTTAAPSDAAKVLAEAVAALAAAKAVVKAERKASAETRKAERENKKGSADAKRKLATAVVQAAANIADLSDADKVTIASWLHHLPADRDEFVKVLPRPDRSDWREKVTAS